MMPLHPSHFVSYALAVLAGFAFGFVLERAGFADARRLAAQFYLTDMRVLKVMFSAVVTAALGIALLRALGLLDWQAVYVNPTYLGAQAVGGAIFGLGFVVGGHCPGTAVVSAVTGRVNGLVFLLGVLLGVLTYAAAYPALASFADAGGARVTLDEALGVSFELTVLGVTVMALALFAGAEAVERALARRKRLPSSNTGSPRLKRTLALVALVLGAMATAFGDHGLSLAKATRAQRIQPAALEPFKLARVLRAGSPDAVVWVIGQTRHPLASPMTLALEGRDDAALLALARPGRRIVLAFADGVRMARVGAQLMAAGHDVSTLAGGLEAWDRALDVDPEPPATGASAQAWQDYRERLALRKYFADDSAARPSAIPAPLPAAPSPRAGQKKREGC